MISDKIQTSIEIAERALLCLATELEQDGQNHYADIVMGHIQEIKGLGHMATVCEDQRPYKP